ncbi:GNAT family N-acetyltransferase [Cohnella sp. GbtcB17]|uniref:GNAT family N-acetyltransferase n=1 Tax=Cohnella sp. GbtcB17 TaxID=2824762 RepID=UPI001C2F224F|nr:GNAT family N-acetyltransferase [Cohnella sp. GbtcB17]
MDCSMDGYRFSDDKTLLQMDRILNWLADSYWANERSSGQIERSIEQSMCIGAYEEGSDRQAGFMRIITDYATFAWVCDVIVDPGERGKGIGKNLMRALVAHPSLQGVHMGLGTRDAHGLYEQYGFERTEAMRRSAR